VVDFVLAVVTKLVEVEALWLLVLISPFEVCCDVETDVCLDISIIVWVEDGVAICVIVLSSSEGVGSEDLADSENRNGGAASTDIVVVKAIVETNVDISTGGVTGAQTVKVNVD
jgi:hypothetical protein